MKKLFKYLEERYESLEENIVGITIFLTLVAIVLGVFIGIYF